jgi:hypothetical protein
MAKRVADIQITKDGTSEDATMQEDTPQRASANTLAGRKYVTTLYIYRLSFTNLFTVG